jgi:hypothetical protein
VDNASPTATNRRAVLITVATPLLVLGAILFCFDPARYSFYPGCAFHKTTGLWCAGCGATRALYQLLHGHPATALRFNPLMILSLPIIVWFGARQTIRFLKNQPCAVNIRPAWLWFIFGVLVVFTVVRNLPGIPPGLLPPEPAASPGLHAAR